MCANNIKQPFIKIKKWNTLESNYLSPVESPLWAQAPASAWCHPRSWMSMPWPRVDYGGEMESPSRLGLGTMNIAPFLKGLVFYQSTCPDFRYGDGKVLGTQPHSTRGLASTHCVPSLNLIKGRFNTLF